MTGVALGASLAALCSSTSEAGTWQYVRPPGTWFFFGSIDACSAISGVPNPDTHPAQFSCDLEVTLVDTLCYNPQNHDVAPGRAATKVTFTGKHQLTQADMLTKKKGRANPCLKVDETADGSPLNDNGLCVNRNWILQEVLTRQFNATCRTEQCTGTLDNPCATTVVKDTQRCQCTLPAEFDINNQPNHCDLLHPETCTAYQCVEVNASGVPTGQLCQFN
jgi:hypothetical protein